MKKLMILFLVVLFYNVSAYSQDTIITKEGEIILAKILSLNETEICYNKFNCQEGAIITIKILNVSIIKWGNGEIEKIKIDSIPYIENIVSYKHYNNNRYFTKDEFKLICEKYNLIKYYNKYVSGRSQANTGATFFVLGVLIGVGGIITICLSEEIIIATIICAIGDAMMIPGFINMIVGNARRRSALSDYNEHATIKH